MKTEVQCLTVCDNFVCFKVCFFVLFIFSNRKKKEKERKLTVILVKKTISLFSFNLTQRRRTSNSNTSRREASFSSLSPSVGRFPNPFLNSLTESKRRMVEKPWV